MKKTCTKCKEEKELEDFPKHKKMKDGHINQCKVCRSAYIKQHYKNNKEQYQKNSKQWREDNKEYCQEYKKQYAKDKEEYLKEYRAAWYQGRKNEPEFKTIRNKRKATYRATKLKATPIWSTNELQQLVIEEAYSLAQLRTKQTGITWHVDHIIPLQHNKVCGLHVAENLQVIPASENLRKNNTYHV